MEFPTIDHYNLAIKQELTGLVLDGQEVPVVYKNPEVEVAVKDVPSIVFFRHKLIPDLSRSSNDYMNADITYDLDGEKDSVERKKYPEPFNILYTIRYYFRLEQHASILMTHVLRSLPRTGFITTLGQDYDFFLEEAPKLLGTGYKDFGEVDTEREFSEQLMYSLEAVIDMYDSEFTKLTKELPTLSFE